MNTLKIVTTVIGIAVVASALIYARGQHQSAVADRAELAAHAAQYQAAAATASAQAEYQRATLQAQASALAAELAQAQAKRDVQQQTVTKVIREAAGACLNEPVSPDILAALRSGGIP